MKIAKNLFFIIMVVVFFLLFWFALKYILNTEYPILPVSSSSMCTISSCCDGFSHPFESTLHVGDLVIVQGVNASNVECNYPYSEILVFHTPKQNPNDGDELIITRAVAKREVNGTIYFLTKSDGEGPYKWLEQPNLLACYTFSEKLLVGKVIFRIPWVGHLVLFIQNAPEIFIIIIIILLIVGLVISVLMGKKVKHKF